MRIYALVLLIVLPPCFVFTTEDEMSWFLPPATCYHVSLSQYALPSNFKPKQTFCFISRLGHGLSNRMVTDAITKLEEKKLILFVDLRNYHYV